MWNKSFVLFYLVKEIYEYKKINMENNVHTNAKETLVQILLGLISYWQSEKEHFEQNPAGDVGQHFVAKRVCNHCQFILHKLNWCNGSTEPPIVLHIIWGCSCTIAMSPVTKLAYTSVSLFSSGKWSQLPPGDVLAL